MQHFELNPVPIRIFPADAEPLRCQWDSGDGPCQGTITHLLSRPPRDAFLCDQHAREAVEFMLINMAADQARLRGQAQLLQPDIDRLNVLLDSLPMPPR